MVQTDHLLLNMYSLASAKSGQAPAYAQRTGDILKRLTCTPRAEWPRPSQYEAGAVYSIRSKSMPLGISLHLELDGIDPGSLAQK